MTAEPVAAQMSELNRCPRCREKGVVMLRYQIGQSVPVIEGQCPTGRLVMVKYGSRWGVRDLVAGEVVPTKFLRMQHECRPHPFDCMAPGCRAGARLFAGGTFCEDHRP